MTNKEKYRQAFSAIHVSEEFSKELKNMEQTKKHTKTIRFSSAVAACLAVCLLVAASATVAYAADIGGFRQTVDLWIHGKQTEAQIDFDGQGNYDMEYIDGDGNVRHQSGGGVALGPGGEETPLSPEELIEHISAERPEVVYEEDGRAMVYWRDQAIDITDRFDEDGFAYILLEDGGETWYVTAKYQAGFACDMNEFASPDTFSD